MSRATAAALAATRRRPRIAPITDDGARPRWSVMIPTCDDGELLREALASVLAQDPGPEVMQVAVIDDASDPGAGPDVAAVVRELSGDRAQVIRHDRRWGAPATFTHCLQAARGELVHILHADDWVLPGFYDAYDAHLRTHPAGLAVSRSWFVDEHGTRLGLSGELEVRDGYLVDAERRIALDNPINFVSAVVARDAVERVGGFDPDLPHANDWELWTRLAHEGAVAVVPVEAGCYRRHRGSDTTRLRASMTYLTDPVATATIIVERISDPGVRREVAGHNRRRFARSALEVGALQAAAGHHRLAATSASWAVWLDPTRATMTEAARLAARAARNRVGWPTTGSPA